MRNFIAIIVMAVALTACEGGTNVASPGSSIASPAPASIQVPQVVNNAAAPVSLTYYSLTETQAPVNGWIYKTVTMTGSCVVYLNNTYCWDDGLKTLEWTSNNFTYGPFNYSYFGFTGTLQALSICSGGCAVDPMSAPQQIVGILAANISSQEIQSIFNLGVAHQVSCTETDSQLNCGDFSLNL